MSQRREKEGKVPWILVIEEATVFLNSSRIASSLALF